jgi:AraC-like DNA-binding protein
MHPNDSVSSTLLESLLAGAKFHNANLSRIFKNAGLDPDILHNNERLHLDHVGPLLRSLWLEMEDEASGFLTKPLKLGVFSMMCHALITSGNLRRGLLRSARFIELLCDDLSLELKEVGSEAHFIIHYKNPHNLETTFFITSLFVIWIRLSCWLIDQPIMLERIQFEFPKPTYSDEFSLMFPCRHSFSQTSNRVVFNNRLLSIPIKQDSETLSSFLLKAPESLLTQFRSDNSLTAQIKRLILHRKGMQTEIENMNFELVSSEFNMTTHTLRRRLKNEGNSFQDIKDSIRRDRAMMLLDNPAFTLHDISRKLGFSEPAAFNRAFKKWTGLTPGGYRELNR